MTTGPYREITTERELRELIAPPNPVVHTKSTDRFGPLERAWIGRSPFCVLATSGADGSCDVSPRGDPPGFAHVLGDRLLALPDRPGNRRADSWRNLLGNPRVALMFVVPGRGDTLRVNGRGRLVTGSPFLAGMAHRGHVPALALLVEPEEIYFHCAKSFLRAALWDPDSWDPEAVPSRARIARATEWTDVPLAALEERYGPRYARQLYGTPSADRTTERATDPTSEGS
ncbi:MSMEG_1061 family FMN-dependent PPOX-type flavoprotein [Streptomyces sp. NPDC057682]|uniref:MSMEG_1061 family FMN-dependent PPOX-type flavoprotein n=1 Tax=Streptomyces sp. NPDC057682 TaxID=3346210 RepID=UPI003690CC2E